MGLKIGLQDNGDDNLILGLRVDKVSLYEKVKIQLGVDKRREREREGEIGNVHKLDFVVQFSIM